MCIFAKHGLFDAEAVLGQRFYIDIQILADLSFAGESDDSDGTVDWADLVQVVIEAFTVRRYRLVEAAAIAITTAILDNFSIARSVRVEIRKPSAPVEAVFAYSAIVIERERQL